MQQPGPLLASGRDADVYEYGPGLVLRRYRRPGGPTEREAALMEYARTHGVPVPRVHLVTETDLVMARVDGPTMLADLGRRPWMVRRHARMLAQLHDTVHEVAAPEWLSRSVGEGDRLLHLDLHPDNVLLGSDGPAIIDWANAHRGPAAVDVAVAWVIGEISVGLGSGFDAWAARTGVGWFIGAFLSGFDRREIESHLETAVSFRLGDRNVSEDERRAIREFARRHLGEGL